MQSYLDMPTKYVTDEVHELLRKYGYGLSVMYEWGYPEMIDNSFICHFIAKANGFGHYMWITDELIKRKIPFEHTFYHNQFSLNYRDIRYNPFNRAWVRLHSDGYSFHYFNDQMDNYRRLLRMAESYKKGEVSSDNLLRYLDILVEEDKAWSLTVEDMLPDS